MLCNYIMTIFQFSLSVYQRQVEERTKQIHDLEESTLSLDDHAKRLHKQFRLNRENYERSDVWTQQIHSSQEENKDYRSDTLNNRTHFIATSVQSV